MSTALTSQQFFKTEQYKDFLKNHENLNSKEFFVPTVEAIFSSSTTKTLSCNHVLDVLVKKEQKYRESLENYLDQLITNRSKDLKNQHICVVQLGGRAEKASTELHDIAFGVGRCLEECFPQLAKQWFGIKTSVHHDSSLEVKTLDGYNVSLSPKKSDSSQEQLYFLNYGSYIPGIFGEFHRFSVEIAETRTQAISKGAKTLKGQFNFKLESKHLDDAIGVDDVQVISEKLPEGTHLVITSHSTKTTPRKYRNDYIPLDFETYDPTKYCALENKTTLSKIYAAWTTFVAKLKSTHSKEGLAKLSYS